MSDEKAIVPVEQRQIEFYEDKFTAVVAPDGTVYVPVRPLCDLIGVNWASQYTKLKNDAVLSNLLNSVVITQRSSDSSSNKPNTSTMVCIPLDYLNGWLFSINANRVKEGIKEAVIRYQTECYKVLFDAFSTGVAVRPDSDIMQSTDESAVTFRTLVQLARIAREHYYLTKKVEAHDEQLADHTKRLGLIEAQLSNPDAYVTQEQAQQIATAVKAIALKLGETSQKNEFGGVYGALYAKFGITSYKRIPAATFDEAMVWLRQWWVKMTKNEPPLF